jgi:hypothetical protein
MFMRVIAALAGAGIALVAVGSAGHAQVDTVRAGSAARLQLAVGVDSSQTYAVRGDERRWIMTYVETISEVAEGYLIVGENVRPDGQSFSVDSLIVARGSLAPLWHSDHSPAGHMNVRYAGGRLTGTSDSAGASTRVDVAVPAGAFDYSMARMVVNLLPLRPGYAGVVVTHDIRRGAVSLPFQVLGEEEVTVGGRTARGWKVEVDLGRAKAVRWIDQTTRTDLRTVVTFPGGQMVAEPN